MNDNNLIEKQIDSTLVYTGSFFTLHKDKVLLPNDNHSYREYIIHPKAVVVVPILDNGNVVLIRQFRYPLNKIMIEVPAGKVDPNEDLKEAANRELLEETGYDAKTLDWVGEYYPCAGYSSEVLHLYIARDLTLKGQVLDHDEFVEIFSVPYQQAIEMIEQGKITDLKTVSSLYRVKKLL